VDIHALMTERYPEDFPLQLLIQTGQRLLQPSPESNEPLWQEVMAAVLHALVQAVLNDQIPDAGDHAAVIALATAGLQRSGAFALVAVAAAVAATGAVVQTTSFPAAVAVADAPSDAAAVALVSDSTLLRAVLPFPCMCFCSCVVCHQCKFGLLFDLIGKHVR
jgi:hypothetical protein